MARKKKKLNQKTQILRALALGPATAFDLSQKTGLPLTHCSAYANSLWKAGLVERSADASSASPNKVSGLYLYWRTE